MRKAVERVKFRLHFMGWPAEPFWNTAAEGEAPHWIADWRYEIALIEHALHGSPITAPEKPTDTKPRHALASSTVAPVSGDRMRAALKRLLEAYDYSANEFEAAAAAQQARDALAVPTGVDDSPKLFGWWREDGFVPDNAGCNIGRMLDDGYKPLGLIDALTARNKDTKP